MSGTESTGRTTSEIYLGRLCRDSFLSLWSHQNPTIDKGRTFSQREGKELCDLLIVFENNIIIFSDKSCEMTNSGDLQVDWSRWYKKSIKSSAKQIFGAERILRDFSDRVFADKHCQLRLPVEMPSPKNWKVHRIIVALGAGKRCASYFGGNSLGSLVIRPDVQGDEHLSKNPPAGPFVVGQPDLHKGFVHIFDDINLDIVLRELDTATDFIEYLNAKEVLYRSGRIFESHGEEETLAHYLSSMSPNVLGSFEFIESETLKSRSSEGDKGRVVLREGSWNEWSSSPLRNFKMQVQEPSNFWDQIIERISQAAITGELAYGQERTIQNHERNLRFWLPNLACSVQSWRGECCKKLLQRHRM